MKTNKKGISLIVLVITIIVMIILAAAIILSLNGSGIIERANEATAESDMKTMQEELAVKLGEAMLRGTPNEFEGMSAEDVLDSAKNYTGKYVIQNGELVEKSNEPQIEYSPASWFFVSGNTITGLTAEGGQQTSIVIPAEINGVAITTIGEQAFISGTFTNVFIPITITSFESRAFYSCGSLTAINYAGTMEQWNSIEKASGGINKWNGLSSITSIICSDGTITL